MKIKDYYSRDYAGMLADRISEKYTALDKKGFIEDIAGSVEGKEYTQRMQAIVEVFDRYLPEYPETIRLFRELLGPELSSLGNMYSDGMWLAPIGRYVEEHCADHPEHYDASAAFIKELTKRYTGEFAMRPLIRAYPQKSMTVLKKWSQDKSVFVRRLSSECMRISLPWAKKMTSAVEQFDAYTEILGNLRHDEDKYIRLTVANNLNDLYKYDSEKARFIVDAWMTDGTSEATLWIIHHGSRSLRKKKKAPEKNHNP
ncbi:DNA alkylation repair protein [Brucepastera parasyntrophica]|uniref:DNA alkylation repair protein n=1 Tax=Brucepastera parasyntrophica TaxID=2880008 RepID=UPI00210E401E|nr:DNA alkylation repair protein [Brucepastera parasyntrophica]ULQ59263.1 DNA alkylation repair protein [Brucepastera parasyntrophica]